MAEFRQPPTEGPAEHVANALQILMSQSELAGGCGFFLSDANLEAVVRRLRTALRQLRANNPAGPMLAIVNPPGRRRLMADAVHEIAYRHADDGKDYVHEFERPDDVRLIIVADDKVLLDGDGMRIIQMFPG